MNNITIEGIAERIRQHRKFILLSHTNPDADTVGSVVALAHALKKNGNTVNCLCDCDIPDRISFIGKEFYSKDCSVHGDELIISVDVASPSMLGSLCEKFESIVDIRIDHHGKGGNFGKFNYVEPSAAAAGEIIFELLTYMQMINDAKVISSLYAAIASDTGCFRYSNTTAKTHMTAAYLLSLGAPASDINEALFETVSFSSLSIYPLFLESCQAIYNGRVNLITVSNEAKRRYGLCDSDLEELSSLSRQAGGAQLGIVIKQRDNSDKEYKLSMRSRKQINCSEIAAYFGGGGHIRASGATIYADSPEKATEAVIVALEKFFR